MNKACFHCGSVGLNTLLLKRKLHTNFRTQKFQRKKQTHAKVCFFFLMFLINFQMIALFSSFLFFKNISKKNNEKKKEIRIQKKFIFY